MRAPRILAVDIGAGHVACGVFTLGASGRLVLQQFALESHSADPAQEARWPVEVTQSLGAIAARRKLSGAAAITVPGHLALTKFIKTSSIAKEKRGKIVSFEATENIPYPLEEVVWDYLVVADDGFDLDVMLTAVKSDAMQALCSAADAAGFPVESATPASIALWRAFRYNYPQVCDSVIVVNIGARTTSLLFIEADRAQDARAASGGRFYVRTLPVAGNVLTQAIAEELRIEFSAAEMLKVQVLSGQSDLPAGSPSRAAVQRAATSFVTRLQLEITRSTVNHRRQSGGAAPVAVYVTGGGSLIDDLPAALAERLKLPVERYQPLKNVDLSADARVSGAENAAQVMADLVGLAIPSVNPTESGPSLLPPSLTAALAFRKRQPRFLAAAALVIFALLPPMVYFHYLNAATLERISQHDAQLMPLRAIEHRNAQNLARLEEATKQITALRGAYETKANWITFLGDLQDRLVKIEDVWLDRLQVVRPPPLESGELPPADGGQNPEGGQIAENATPASDTGAAGDPTTLPAPRPVRLALSGRLLDVRNPQSKVSPESTLRVKQLLASFTGSQFIAAVENERFDHHQNGLLKFDFTLVINPRKNL